MDMSTIQSKSGGSDFSIKRILSDETKSEDITSPNWLCCTRYQPPRISRPPSSGNSGRARRASRHARVPFTAAQAQALEAAYSRAPYLAPPALRALAAALQLRDDRIKIWFQNRRARERREKSSTITPPHAVLLPPTNISRTLISSPWIPERPIRGQTLRFIESRLEESAARFSQDNSACEESEGDRSVNDDRPETPLDVETLDGTE